MFFFSDEIYGSESFLDYSRLYAAAVPGEDKAAAPNLKGAIRAQFHRTPLAIEQTLPNLYRGDLLGGSFEGVSASRVASSIIASPLSRFGDAEQAVDKEG